MPADFQNSLSMWSEHAGKVLQYRLVEDNDDSDDWPDTWEHWDPFDPLYIALKDASGVDPENQPTQTALDFLAGGQGTGIGLRGLPGAGRRWRRGFGDQCQPEPDAGLRRAFF